MQIVRKSRDPARCLQVMRSRVAAFVESDVLGAASIEEDGVEGRGAVFGPESLIAPSVDSYDGDPATVPAEEPSVEKKWIEENCSGSKKLEHRLDVSLIKSADSSMITEASMLVGFAVSDILYLNTCICKTSHVLGLSFCQVSFLVLSESSGEARQIRQRVSVFTFDPGIPFFVGDAQVIESRVPKKWRDEKVADGSEVGVFSSVSAGLSEQLRKDQ